MRGKPSGTIKNFALCATTSLSCLFGGCVSAPKTLTTEALRPTPNTRVLNAAQDADIPEYRFERTHSDADYERIYAILDMIANYGGAEARALVEYFDDHDIAIMLDSLATEDTPGLYNPNDRSMHVLTSKSDAVLAAIIVHEMVHAYQHRNNALTHIYNNRDIQYTMAMTLSGEAGAQATATLVAHKMRENGLPQVWDEFKDDLDLYEDIMDRFEETFESAIDDGRTRDEAYADATKAAWRQYFEHDGRITSYNAQTLESVVRAYVRGDGPRRYIERDHTGREAAKMAELPGGFNYVRDAEGLNEDAIFGDSNDGVFLRAAADAIEGQRLGRNPVGDFSDENLDRYGMFASVDLEDVVHRLDTDENTHNVIFALVFSVAESGAMEASQRYHQRKMQERMMERLRESMPELFETPLQPSARGGAPEQQNSPVKRLNIRKMS